jgi:hypothetical protein
MPKTVYTLLFMFTSLFVFVSIQSFAQNNTFFYPSNLKSITVQNSNLIQIEKNKSIKIIKIDQVDTSSYTFNYDNNEIQWIKKPLLDSVTIYYRILGFNFHQNIYHKTLSDIDSNYVFSSKQFENKNKKEALIEYNPLELNGTYARGVSVGNQQDMVLNSNFNLQANGYLLDSIKIEAALSDNSIPFQPDGNTANLQEFDQISIRLSKKNNALQLGDYNLNRPQSYFLNFTKRVQGLFYESEGFLNNKKIKHQSGISISMAKGEFARNTFNGIEGNQGPYRLTGNHGEQLFVIMAGTEKVYIDNVLLERGENADYIINYNTNEIRFMPRRPINQFSRIQVEFEYRINNYLNSLIYGYNNWEFGKKFKLGLNVYSNQDAKNQGFQQELSSDQKRFLSTIGDSVQMALIPNITQDTFASNKVLYKLKDTLVTGVRYDSIFTYARDSIGPLYSVAFTYVGNGKGEYILSGSNANGRVYEWTPPLNGSLQGNYRAVSLLITPKSHQIVTVNGSYQIDSNKNIYLELSGSNKDPNTFSKINNNTHQAYASKFRYEEIRQLGKRDSLNRASIIWENQIQHEYVQENYAAVAPYRSIEFGREWNVPLNTQSPNEQWMSWNSKIKHKALGDFQYNISQYLRGNTYNGLRNAFGYNYLKNSWRIGINMSIMNSKDSLFSTKLLKPTALIEYNWKKLLQSTIGASYIAEHNKATINQTDSLHSSSFYFDITSFYWKTNASKQMNTSLNYFRRRDFLPEEIAFQPYTYSDNISLLSQLGQVGKHTLQLTANYRKLYRTNTISNSAPDESLLGRMQHDIHFLKNTITKKRLYLY